MSKLCVAAFILVLVSTGQAYAAKLSPEAIAGVQKAIKAIGCTVDSRDIGAKGSGYKADDLQCKDGQYDVYLDANFKITKKVKE
jgi:hypothetical protein